MEMLKLLSANEIVAQVLGFLLLLILLRIFAWKRLLALLDERKERISSEFKKIDDAKLEIESLKSEYSKKLAEIERAAELKVQDAIARGDRITGEIKEKAHEEALRIINSAKESIRQELMEARDELKKKIIDLTIQSTENLIKKKVTEKEDKELVKDFLDGLDDL